MNLNNGPMDHYRAKPTPAAPKPSEYPKHVKHYASGQTMTANNAEEESLITKDPNAAKNLLEKMGVKSNDAS